MELNCPAMSQSLVSIIIPCYNAEPWIAQTLDSAVGQTWRNKEIIVVDDGSRDRSLEIVRSYALLPGVKVIAQENRSASAARNRGLREAGGDYIQFLDADDLLHPEKIEIQMRRLEVAGPDHLASGEWGRFEGGPDGAEFGEYPNHRDMDGVEFLQVFFEATAMMQPAAWLAPRALLDRAGPWDERITLNDDGEYFARVALAAKRILYCPGSRVYYRSGLKGSLSRRKDSRSLESMFLANRLIVERLLAADSSSRSVAAAAYAWKWAAFELYPGRPDLCRQAERECRRLGGSARPMPAGPTFQRLSRLLGWKLAKRLRDRLNPKRG